MANEKDSQVSLDALTAALTQVMQANQPAKKVDVAEYLRRPENREPELKRPVIQNGQPIQIKGASQDTINHLNNLESGEYLEGGIVRVEVRGQEPFQTVHITYPCATVDQRMKIYSLVSSFSDMVQKIAKEQRERK